jgi:hypothetical protein
VRFFKKLKIFIIQLFREKRIPSRDKKIILFLILLIISPFDFIPDWTPIFGQLDDLVMIAIIFDYFFSVLDSGLILSHYPWGMKSFATFRSFARMLGFIVPRFVKQSLWKYVPDPY